ncbi:TonB-dependent receptor [Flavitalea sp.]|nr:TonB-dependent receptor [Flavitalea sp.]
MRLTTFLIFAICLQVSAKGISQTISLQGKNLPIQKIFAEIESQTGYLVACNYELFKLAKPVTISVRDVTLEQFMNQVLKGQPLRYSIQNRTIFISILPDIASKSEQANTPVAAPPATISGVVSDSTGEGLSGVSVQVKGSSRGTTTDENGRYKLEINDEDQVLVFSFIGFRQQEVRINGRQLISINLARITDALTDIVVVGYGTQKKSDITGTVASLPKERLEMVPNINIAQAIQGAIPGVMIQTSNGGAVPEQELMIRGRNSIKASNTPLVVVDGIPYSGSLNDINPNDVKSIEVLMDASSAAIYGSRGANGVILITTKEGFEGKTIIAYDGKYSIQKYVNIPDIMNGEEFYKFKNQRIPGSVTQSEQAVYDAGKAVNWLDLGMRNGASHQHNLSVSGGSKTFKYFISGGFLDVKGLVLNDNYLRATSRINIDTKITNWLSIGTRTQLLYDDRSGSSLDMNELFYRNPLATAYNEDGSLTITPIADDPVRTNPLSPILYDNLNVSNQVITNNYAVIKVPFIPGLSYRLNTGYRIRFTDNSTYRGRNTKVGLDARGSANTDRSKSSNSIIENIISYERKFGKQNLTATGLYSFEENTGSSNTLSASGFPHDVLSWYSAAQAELVTPGFAYNKTDLISQMLRLNYSYDSRYLVTVTGRRDGYSGFGSANKWGFFPSVALGWNFANEKFFPFESIFNQLKLRVSVGRNGNQALGAYETISRLSSEDMVSLGTTLPGYKPSVLGQDNLGWESTNTINAGLDFVIAGSRLSGDINVFRANTSDLLLNRSISPVHGITSITQNIGKTQNKGITVSLNSKNFTTNNFKWTTSANFSYLQNEIVSLYGELDSDGNEIDDLSNRWFIGSPIRVNYDYVFGGVWQTDKAAEASQWGTKPGYSKINDINGDGKLNSDDRQIIGQQDPKVLWGLSNTFSYKNFNLNVFIHGVHGVTKVNDLMSDLGVTAGVRHNTTVKNWWTPENPSNDFQMNHIDAHLMSGIYAPVYENASFVRIKDVSLAYDLPKSVLDRLRFIKLQVYVSGRNLATITDWRGLDPELSSQVSMPLQKEFVFGINLAL